MAETAGVVRGGDRFGAPDPAVLVEELAARGVEAIALTYVDNSGITRVKAIPTARLAAVMAHRGRDVAGVRRVRPR